MSRMILPTVPLQRIEYTPDILLRSRLNEKSCGKGTTVLLMHWNGNYPPLSGDGANVSPQFSSVGFSPVHAWMRCNSISLRKLPWYSISMLLGPLLVHSLISRCEPLHINAQIGRASLLNCASFFPIVSCRNIVLPFPLSLCHQHTRRPPDRLILCC